jgi:N-acetylglucosamine kinase-like BadF-type ATPase
MMARHFVAIDGGNSKTDIVVGREDGAILSFVRGPGSSPDNLGIDGSLGVLDDLIKKALVTADVRADLLVAYLAGVDLPIEVERYSDVVRSRDWAVEHLVDNDLFALLRAGTSDPNAIGVICGAGINAAGRRVDGRTARFPALGPITGDWGGGHHLAAMTLWHAARGEDTRGPGTALAAAVAAHYGHATVEEVGAAIHLGQIPASRIEELTPLLFDVAEAGDRQARRIVARQAQEIISLVRIAGTRLDLLDKPHTVVLGGGVVAARRPLLHDAVLAGVAANAPLASIEVVNDLPVAGAALLALDQWGPVAPEVDAAVRRTVKELFLSKR